MSGHCPTCLAVVAHGAAHHDNCPHAQPKPGDWIVLHSPCSAPKPHR